MKKSEARILVYLMNTRITLKYAEAMSLKLNIDISTISRSLARLLEKKWIFIAANRDNKKFYELGQNTPLKEAKDILLEVDYERQRNL